MEYAAAEQSFQDPVDSLQVQNSFNVPGPMLNKLPVELLVPIFAEAIRNAWANNPYALQILSHVCSQWRDIIEGCPLLHTSFAAARPELTAGCLKNSRAMPLDVVRIDELRHESVDLSINALSPELHRVRALHLSLGSINLVKQLLGLVATHPHYILTELHIVNGNWDKSVLLYLPSIPEIDSESGQVLRSLTYLLLRNVEIPQPRRLAVIPFSLRRLDLMYLGDYAYPPTTNTLLCLLSCCPQLEEFHITSQVPVLHGEWRVFRPTHRPQSLKRIVVDGPCFAALVFILLLIEPSSIPRARFNLTFPISDKAVARLLVPPPSDGSWLLKVGRPRSLRRLDIRSEDKGLILLGSHTPGPIIHNLVADRDIPGPEVQLRITAPEDLASPLKPHPGFWSWPLDASCVEILTIDLSGAFAMPASKAQWCNLLRGLPSLCRVVLHEPLSSEAEAMYQALASPEAAQALYPKLAVVVLVDLGARDPPGSIPFDTWVLKNCPLREDFTTHFEGKLNESV